MQLQKRDSSLSMEQEVKLYKQYETLERLLTELDKFDIPTPITQVFNAHIEEINNFTGDNKALLKKIKKTIRDIIKLLEKEMKIVPRNHYRNTWMALGMSTFGLPIGMLLGFLLGNIALFCIGLPIGMAIGMTLGSSMDKKAFDHGKQLDIEHSF